MQVCSLHAYAIISKVTKFKTTKLNFCKVFFRANRKHIVNLRMIDRIEPYFNGGLLLELKGGEKIEVSRRQTVKFKEMMSL